MTRQQDFIAAVLDPARALPDGITDPKGRPDPKRFAVYRNNVVVGLTDALEEAFPVVRKLVGDEFFRDMGNIFVRAHPPTSPILSRYGADFAEFLAGFEPAKSLPYLPDVARLEQLLRLSYHAADVAPIDPACLQDIAPDALGAARFALAPAVRTLASRWPVHAIWMSNMKDGRKVAIRPEEVLITRPGYDPLPELMPRGGAVFVTALQSGLTLAEAIAAGGADLDLSAMLALLFKGGAITEVLT